MRLNRVGKTFILFLAFTFTISNWISPVLADELQGNTPDCFDFSVLASVDDEKYAHWLDLVEYNDEWYISADNACYFAGFEKCEESGETVKFSRDPFYKGLSLPFDAKDIEISVQADSIVHNGIKYYNFNIVMNELRTKVTYSSRTKLVVFQTCKVFPTELNMFCEKLMECDYYYMDDKETSSAWVVASVNVLSGIFSAGDALQGKDTDEMIVLKSIIKTPPFTDPDMTQYFHTQDKHDSSLAIINKLCGYYSDIRGGDWGEGNTLWSYYGNTENPFAYPMDLPDDVFTGAEAAELYSKIYKGVSTGGIEQFQKDIKKQLEKGVDENMPTPDPNNPTPAITTTAPSGSGTPAASSSDPLETSNLPLVSLAMWDSYKQWQETKDWQVVYINSLDIVFSEDTYYDCSPSLKASVNNILNRYDSDAYDISMSFLENCTQYYAMKPIYNVIKNQLTTPWNSFIHIIDSELGLSESIHETRQTYIINEIQHQCRYRKNVLTQTSDDPYTVMTYKYSAILYLRAYLYGCSLWEDGSALSQILLSDTTNPISGLSIEEQAEACNTFSRGIDEVAPYLATIIQTRDEDLVRRIFNVIGYADRNGDLTYYDEVNERFVTVKIHYYHHNVNDYDGILEELDVGSHFYYGSYEQDNNPDNGPEPIEWIVTSTDGDSVQAQSFYILDSHLFKDKMWFNSELRRWCNSDFLNSAFADYEQVRLDYMQYRGGLNDENQSQYEDFSAVDRVVLKASGKAESTDYAIRNGEFDNYYWYSSQYWNSGYDEPGHSFVKSNGERAGQMFKYNYTPITTITYGIRPLIDISFNAENNAIGKLYSNAVPGDIIVLGKDELDGDPSNGMENIDWIVMGRTENNLFLETYYPINGIEDKDISNWTTSSLREWLNGDFYNDRLNDQERSYIIKSSISCPNGYAADDYFFPQSEFAKYLEYSNYTFTGSKNTRCVLEGITNPVTVCTVMSLDGHHPEIQQIEGMYSHEKMNMNDRSINYQVGESIFLGEYEQDMIASDGREAIEWIIINVSDSKALVISKYCLDYQQITIGKANLFKDWLTTDFRDSAFSDEEKEMIINNSVFVLSDTDCGKYIPKGSEFRTALITHYAYSRVISETTRLTYSNVKNGNYSNNIYLDPMSKFGSIGTTYGTYWALNSSNRGRITSSGDYKNDADDNHSTYLGPHYVRPAMWITLPDTYDVANEQDFINALTGSKDRNYTINIVADFTISQDYSELAITHGNIKFNGHTITINRKGTGEYFYFGGSDSVLINLDGGEETGSAICLDPSYSYFMLRDRHSTINNIKIYVGESEQITTPTPVPTQEFAMYDCYPLEVVYDCPAPHSVGEGREITLTNKSDVEITSWAIEMKFEDAISSRNCYWGASFDESDSYTVILRNSEFTGTIAPNESVTVTIVLKGASNNPKQPTEVKLYDVSPSFATSHTLTLGQVENGTASLSAETAYEGDVITVTTEPQVGYELDSIMVNGQAITGNTFEMPDEDVSIEVKFKKTDYTITVNNTVNGTVSASKTTANIGDEIVLTVNPAAGYELDSIKVNDEIINGTTFIMADSNVVVEITFKIINYTITVSETSNGSVSAANTSANYGEVIQLTVSPDAGYKIDTIKVNGSPISGNSFTMPAEDVVIEAVFEKINYTVTINYAPNGIVSASKNTANYGDEIVLTITPDSGYELDYIKINGDVIEDPSFVMPAGDVTVDVGFKVLVIKNGWELEDGKYYYYQNNKKVTGWVKSGASWYYMDPEDGVMVTGWKCIGGLWYFMAQSGAMQIGWVKSGNSWYYLTPGSGHMVTGWKEIGGKWYYFASSGAMVTNWIDIGGTWYYMDSSGAMVTGWKEISGKWYYFAPSGDMQTGWKYLGGEWYYLRKSGDMVTGWEKIDEKWYYFYSSGAMAHGTTIDGYEISDSGAMV